MNQFCKLYSDIEITPQLDTQVLKMKLRPSNEKGSKDALMDNITSFLLEFGTYVVVVNYLLESEMDSPTLVFLICKSKDNIQAKYAIESSSQPLGISEYERSNLLPNDFKGILPTIEEIEAELND